MAEKKDNGKTSCQKCGHVSHTRDLTEGCNEFNDLKKHIQKLSDKAFYNFIETQRNHIEDDFLNMLEKSSFFKQFYNEAFTDGAHGFRTGEFGSFEIQNILTSNIHKED